MRATSQRAARWGRFSLMALGRRRPIWTARAVPAAPGLGSARRMPATWSRGDPHITGTKCVVRSPPKISAASRASTVQPEWTGRQA
jgi:hypothetical protein